MRGKLFNKTGKKMEGKKADTLLKEFKKKFATEDYNHNILQVNRSKLIWCNLLPGFQVISTEDVQCLQIQSRQKVYYYGERDNEMFETTFSEVCNFVKELEPWDEIDSEIFDDSFTWFIAITHEDISLVYGIESFN